MKYDTAFSPFIIDNSINQIEIVSLTVDIFTSGTGVSPQLFGDWARKPVGAMNNSYRVSNLKLNSLFYLFICSRAGGILRTLQSDWFRERAVFSYLLTTVMVTNYAKRRVKLRIERAKFQFVLIVFCNSAIEQFVDF